MGLLIWGKYISYAFKRADTRPWRYGVEHTKASHGLGEEVSEMAMMALMVTTGISLTRYQKTVLSIMSQEYSSEFFYPRL